MSNYYLKPNIKAEPLIWQWYAWSYLIPPLTAGCNVVERHIKIMQSFVQNPKIHAQAVKNPKLLGGPFMDLDEKYVNEIDNLITSTKKDCAQLIELHNSFKDFDRILQNEAKGDSLVKYYESIPLSLKGLVELVYDLNNHPSIRLIEPLIYQKYYSTKKQKIALSEINSDIRKFILSTPYIEDNDTVYLDIPFSDPALDQLFSMRDEPQNLKKILEILKIPNTKHSLFESFFTSTPPQKSDNRNYSGEELRIRYFGHACILLQTKNTSILFDPIISYSIHNVDVERYVIDDLPDSIDYVIITHNHQDHLIFETLLQLRHKIKNIVFPNNNVGSIADPCIRQILKNTGFQSLIELKEMDTINLKDLNITALPFLGEHSDLNIQTKLSYCIQFKNKKFLFAADSSNLDSSLYEHIYNYIGNIEMLFLGMECDGAPLTWLYGPLLSNPLLRKFDNNRTLSGSNFQQALAITKVLKCKHAYVYAMGQEPWLNHIMALQYLPDSIQILESNKFVNACKEQGIYSERLFGKKEWIVL